MRIQREVQGRLPAVLFGLATLVCGPALAQEFLYVANGGANAISAFQVDAASGGLTTVPGSPFSDAGANPQRIAAEPSGRFLYAANYSSNDISGYSISLGTGVLTSLGPTIPTGATPAGIAIDPTGQFLYTANESGSVSAFRINQGTGALTQVSGSPYATGTSEYEIVINPTGTLLYALSNDGPINAYEIVRGTGALKPVPGSPFSGGANLAAGVGDLTGRYLYVADEGFGAGDVLAYRISASGISAVPGSPFSAGPGPDWITVDPTDRFVFVTDGYTPSSLYLFSIVPSSGALVLAAGSPYPISSELQPNALACNASGQFVYVALYDRVTGAGSVMAFRLSPATGRLTPIATYTGLPMGQIVVVR